MLGYQKRRRRKKDREFTVKVTFFSAGSHGAGHVTRAWALQQALARQAPQVAFTALLPPSPFLHRLGDAGRAVEIDHAALLTKETAATSPLARAIADSAPDIVLVDMFWAPLACIQLPCPVWLMLRSVPPVWLVGPREVPFDSSRYARILAIEPAPALSAFEATPPVVATTTATPPFALSRHASRAALAALMGVSAEAPIRVVVSSGLQGDRPVLEAESLRQGGHWHSFDGLADDAVFPISPLLTGADAIIAAPGYNTFWESRLLGFDDRCTFVPIKRTIDNTDWRAALPSSVRFDENGADVIARMLVRG
jgi:hypothetical protein